MSIVADDPPAYFERHVFFCVNVRPEGHELGCCAAKGSVGLRNYMKAKAKERGLKRVRINQSGCLDRCAQGPTLVIYPEGVWYRCATTADVDEVIDVHLVKGGRVPRLMLDTPDKPGD